jgi:hypothetical protein
MMMFSKGKPAALCDITSLDLGGEILRLTGVPKGVDDVRSATWRRHGATYSQTLTKFEAVVFSFLSLADFQATLVGIPAWYCNLNLCLVYAQDEIV